MHLSELSIRNFRSCRDTSVTFPEPVTVLIGENGSGKSNIVDSIRLAVQPASGRRHFYFDGETDPTVEAAGSASEVSISLTFGPLDDAEKGLYLSQIVDPDELLRFTTVFTTNPDPLTRPRVNRLIGLQQMADPEPITRERISCVYLPPLRDAVREIDSTQGTRLATVMSILLSDSEQAEFEQAGTQYLQGIGSHSATSKSVEAIQEHLSQLTKPVNEQVVTVEPRPISLQRLARALRLQLAENGIDPHPGDTSFAGLGYANLLYISTIALELSRSTEFDLTILLIEEPEAHLHPQLQSVLLDYLYEQVNATNSTRLTGHGAPAGFVQAIVTTHSPNIASAVSTKNIIKVSKKPSQDPSPRPRTTVTHSLAASSVSDTQRRKVDRYLDVTRSSLLFAKQVILVEGIAESLLLKRFAQYCVFPASRDNQEGNRSSRNQFKAISVISIGGTDFEPFLKVLLNEADPHVERVVVITDRDKDAVGVAQGVRRQEHYYNLFANHVQTGVLSVHVGESTLESDLIYEEANRELLRSAYLTLHRRSERKWDEAMEELQRTNSAEERRQLIKDRLVANLEKGEFAHIVSELLERSDAADQMVIPRYLESALRAAVV